MQKVTEEVSSEESSEICRESLELSTAPTWDKDKTYF
jgi:hypothetical protein